MTEVMDLPYYFVTVLTALPFIVTLSNVRSLDSLGASRAKSGDRNNTMKVSVLVPARDEEENIAQCLRALAAQNYEALERLVLDDRSTDRTAQIIQGIAESDPRVRMISGAELPTGWVGKNWACHQLSQEATGEFLLFVDSDTILSEKVILSAVTEALNRDVDLLTVMPRRIGYCIVEKLMFPFIDWASFCWIPMGRAHKSQNPHLSATFGQFMLFKRAAYQEVGGHQAIRATPLDDFELGRATKRQDLRWMLFEGASCVEVRPYKGNREAFRSVSRSVFPAIYHRFSVLVLLSVVVLTLGFVPPLALATSIMADPRETEPLLIAAASMAMVAIPWIVVCRKFKHNSYIVLLYPFAITLMVIVAFHSMASYIFGSASWKSRRIAGPGR